MIKTKLIMLMIMVSLIGFCQAQHKKLQNGKIGTIDWSFNEAISDKDTTMFLYIGFQNMEYVSVSVIGSICINTDIGSMYITDHDNLIEFIQRLKIMIDKCGLNINYDYGNLKIYEFSKVIYIFDEDKYTTITKNQALKLITKIEPYSNLL